MLSREDQRPMEGGAGAVSSYAPLTLSFRCAEILGATSCKGIGDGDGCGGLRAGSADRHARGFLDVRSEEHTSELQSLMRISYAVLCLTKKKKSHKDCDALNSV